jgi:hypothetical protein
MTSFLHSQTVSNDNCIVPCNTLKNALKLKIEFEKCNTQLSIVRDSVLVLNQINLQKDTIVVNKDKEISLLNDNVLQTKKIATEHADRADFYKKEVDKQKRLKLLSIGSGILGIVASILLF